MAILPSSLITSFRKPAVPAQTGGTTTMFKTMDVKLNERVVLLRDSLPVRALGPGRHTVWGWGFSVERWQTDALLFQSMPEVRAVMPAHWFGEVTLAKHERAVLFHEGRPVAFLRPGTHRYWLVDDSVGVQIFAVDEALPPLTVELQAIIPRAEYLDVTVREFERGLQYVQGRLVRTLEPGRYAFWLHPDARVEVTTVDMRVVQVPLVGQDLMTKDKVTLRLSLTVEYAVEDAALATHAVANIRDAVYLLVQLASREFVSGVTLDELLAGRDSMTRALESETVDKARRFGVRVERVGVKDVVLPGEMKTLLNRVIEAEKEAAANVILRREETAATRSLANTAKVMSENPILLRLKELDSLKEIASRIKDVRVVVGADGLKTLLPAGLLND
jgi:regulator of protease activity HflC (stomatin/prohibitin superfamily)